MIDDAPTSHVDLVPTLLGAAGIDEAEVAQALRAEFSEVHPLPGRNLMPVVDGALAPDRNRPVYVLTRDNMLEGDTGASGFARRIGRTVKPPAPLRIKVPAHVGANFEGVVGRVEETDAAGGAGHLWKLVRTFDDPATWTEPGVRHLAANGLRGDEYRTEPLADQWELYDLTADGVEHVNRWRDDDASAVFAHLKTVLKHERARSVPERNVPWPYVRRRATAPATKRVPPPAKLLRKGLRKLGLHPSDPDARDFELLGKRALIVCTNHGVLDIGKPTGVFASEMTVPYYAFLDAGMFVDLASPNGGVIPVDPQSVKPVIRSEEDDRFLVDDDLREKVGNSLAIGEVDIASYDIVFLAGGWGAAFDLGTSDALGEKITEANSLGKVIGGVCHGPLGLLKATASDGRPLVEGRRISAVTDKQVRELGIESTPQHPERELRAAGAVFESESARRDPLANHWVVDGNLVTGQNQNAGPMVAREMMQIHHGRRNHMSDTPRYGTIEPEYAMRLATTPPDDDGPVWMVNLMKYRDVAAYADGRDSTISGREADDRYTPLGPLAAVGAEIVFAGEVDQQLLGDSPIWIASGWSSIRPAIVHRDAVTARLPGTARTQGRRHVRDDRHRMPTDRRADRARRNRIGRLGRRAPSADR